MRRVLVPALFGLIVASPCAGETPSKNEQPAVGAAVAMALIQVNGCPSYRLNRERLSAFLDQSRVTPSMIMERYLTFATALAKRLNEAYNADSERLCSQLWDMFGDSGFLPHLMERQD